MTELQGFPLNWARESLFGGSPDGSEDWAEEVFHALRQGHRVRFVSLFPGGLATHQGRTLRVAASALGHYNSVVFASYRGRVRVVDTGHLAYLISEDRE